MKRLVCVAVAALVAAHSVSADAVHQHVLSFSSDGGSLNDAEQVNNDRHVHLGPLPRPRIAIVGGGAAGTSSAYFLHFLSEQEPRLKCDVDLYEANDYLGGRSTVIYPFHGEYEDNDGSTSPRMPAIELGASIFVPANKNMWKAVEEFNLTLQDGHGGGSNSEEDVGGVSVWNGEQFVYHEATWSWWNIPKLVWRYGWSPLTTRDTVKSMLASFLRLYGSDFQRRGPYETIHDFAQGLQLDGMAFKSTLEYLESQNVGELFIQELVGAATRVNYGQDPSLLQAFEGMVSMAASGASSVKGGNRQVFEEFAVRSQAHLHLETEVQHIRMYAKDERRSPFLLRTKNRHTGSVTSREYDAVIFASPLHPPKDSDATRVEFFGLDPAEKVPPLDYVRLHVTIVVTNATNPRSEFFGTKEPMPRTILSTFEPFLAGRVKSSPRVNSLNYLRSLGKVDGIHGTCHVVKLFSASALSQEDLAEAFGSSEVVWTYRKDWAAYPRSPPFGEDERLPAFKPEPGVAFYYPSAMERWVSTMETETVSAWNAVSLLVRDLFGYQVNSSWAEGQQ